MATYSLTPLNDLELLSSSGKDAHYESIGYDPYFNIDLTHPLKKGWYELKVRLEKKKGIIKSSRLYFDTGNGYNEDDSILLPLLQKDRIEWLVYFPSDIHNLRFDPMMDKGEFSVNTVELSLLSRYNAAVKKFKALQQKSKSEKKNATLSLIKAFSTKGMQGFKKELWDGAIWTDRKVSASYSEWIRLYDTLSSREINKMKEGIEKFKYSPLISVIIPVYNPDVSFLKKAIESVQAQVYTNWEICIADDASTDPKVKKVLEDYSKKDPRIKVVFRKKNGHISEASNSAIDLSAGEYLALLDQDDELRPHSLYMVAKELNKDKNIRLLFSDEDKIDKNGERFDHYFKPEWSLDLLYGHNFVSHLGVYHSATVKKIGGFRKGYEGSQDYDLVLRFIEQIKPSQIKKINAILYHWRAIPGSTALAANNKNYAYVSGLKAIQEHLDRTKQKATVENIPNYTGLYRVKYALPEKKPLVSLIIPTKDKVEMLDNCIQSILTKTKYSNYEIIIVDNNSEEKKSLDYFKKITHDNKKVSVLNYPYGFNYSAINNFAVKHAKGTVLGLVNNDIEVISEDWLGEMVSHALRKEVGAVGAKLYYSNDTIQHAGVIIGLLGIAGHILKHIPRDNGGYCAKALLTQNFSAVTGACMIMRKEVYNEVGGLNEKDLTVAFNDVDICLKIREQGYLIVWTAFAELYHLESISRGLETTPEKQERFNNEIEYMKVRWNAHNIVDPYFNPNFTKDFENYTLKFHTEITNHWYENAE